MKIYNPIGLLLFDMKALADIKELGGGWEVISEILDLRNFAPIARAVYSDSAALINNTVSGLVQRFSRHTSLTNRLSIF